MSEAARARMAAIPLEAKIDKLQRLQGGDWKLTLTVSDMPVALLTVPLGTRYQCAFVEVGDDEQPIDREDTPGMRAKKHFEAKCGQLDVSWSTWLSNKLRHAGYPEEFYAASTRDMAKELMGIKSGNEIIDDPEPWYRLWEEYQYRNVKT